MVEALRVCPRSLFLRGHRSRAQPENEQHNREASCHFKSGDPSNLLSIHSGPRIYTFPAISTLKAVVI